MSIDWAKTRGMVAVVKPKGPTSHDIINRLRRLTGEYRIGHAGTLDPLASGVLVVGIGRDATKVLAREVKKEKEYKAIVRFGATSTTDDAGGEVTPHAVAHKPTRAEVKASLAPMIGRILQVPPAFSAVKKAGVKAYKRARRGNEVKLEPRLVEVKNIEIAAYRWPRLTLTITTGPGAYIRSIARDLGNALGVGGYVQELQRIRVGDYRIDTALRLPPHPKDQDMPRGFVV